MKWFCFIILSFVIHLLIFSFPFFPTHSMKKESSVVKIRMIETPPLSIKENIKEYLPEEKVIFGKKEEEMLSFPSPKKLDIEVPQISFPDKKTIVPFSKPRMPEKENVFLKEEMSLLEGRLIDRLVEEASGERLCLYLHLIKQKIEALKRYPPEAKRKGLEGVVLITFTVLNNGEIEALKVKKSSGHRILDEEALSFVKEASPFPPFPQEISRNEIVIRLPIRFTLQRKRD